MQYSKSEHEKFLEQIASFDPLLNPDEFENLDPSKHTNTDSSNSKPAAKPSHPESTYVKRNPLTKRVNSSLRTTHDNLAFNFKPTGLLLPLSSLRLSNFQPIWASQKCIVRPMIPIITQKKKEGKFKIRYTKAFNRRSVDRSSFQDNSSDLYDFQNLTESKSHNFHVSCIGFPIQPHKLTSPDSQINRRQSFQEVPPDNIRTFKSGRFNITRSSHSEVSQSENSETEDEIIKTQSKHDSKDEDNLVSFKETKKVRRFTISYHKKDNDFSQSLDSSNNSPQPDKIDDFYDIQQFSMPVLHKAKKKNQQTNHSSNKIQCNTQNINPDSAISGDSMISVDSNENSFLDKSNELISNSISENENPKEIPLINFF